MIAQRSIDVSHLPPYDISSQAPLWWGQLFLAVIEGTMFAILIAMYFYYRLSVDVWPPPGEQLPHLGLSTLALVPLLVSCLGSYWASEAAKKNDRHGMIFGLTWNLVFAGTALALRLIVWHSFNFSWSSSIHGSMVWTILGLHTLDYVADLIFTAVLILILISGRVGPKQRLGVHVDSIVWYFIVLSWIPLYIVIYWGPRIVGAPA